MTYFALTLKQNQAGLCFSEIIEEKRVLPKLNKTQPFLWTWEFSHAQIWLKRILVRPFWSLCLLQNLFRVPGNFMILSVFFSSVLNGFEHPAWCCPAGAQVSAYGGCDVESSKPFENDAIHTPMSPSKPIITCLLICLQKGLSEKRKGKTGRKLSE